MIPFELKAVVANEDNPIGSHTIYLFNKEQKLVIPIKVSQGAVDAILLAREGRDEPRPHIHDTTKRLISALDGTVERIIISGYDNEIFYSYIRIVKGATSFDVDAKPSDAISVALRTGALIYVDEQVAENAGVKITPEMLA